MTHILATIALFVFGLLCRLSLAFLWLVMAALGVVAFVLFYPFVAHSRRKYRTVNGKRVQQWRF